MYPGFPVENMATRDGIYYNLSDSQWKTAQGELIFYFSSQKHLQKFLERLKDNRAMINRSLENRFDVEFKLTRLPDMVLYRKIETRGFLIMKQGEGAITCLKQITLNGERLILKHSPGK